MKFNLTVYTVQSDSIYILYADKQTTYEYPISRTVWICIQKGPITARTKPQHVLQRVNFLNCGKVFNLIQPVL